MLSKFDYKRPATIEEALEYLETPGKNMVISGGTDLLVQIRSKMCKPDVVVDITRIPELKRIQDDSENIFIGGTVTFSEIMEDPIIDRYLPLLKQASMQFGSPLIRNLGTIAGNTQTASPAGDGLIALFTLMAEVVLISTKRERKVPITDFIIGPKKTSKEPNEIIKGFQISKKKYDFNRFFKIGKRNALAISIVNGGIMINFGKNKEIEEVVIVLGAVAPTPVRMVNAEKLLQGNVYTSELSHKLNEQIQGDVSPISDIRASKEYRRYISGVMCKRIINNMDLV